MASPLSGITILDLTRFYFGPKGVVMLSDMGAEVIKVEQPSLGDDSRRVYLDPDGFGAMFESVCRNKRSITVNLQHPRGKEIILKLIPKVDVVAENFLRGTMDKLGLGYDTLSKLNPKLIYACASGFGPKGPLRNSGAADFAAQARGGVMWANGGVGQEPRRIPDAPADSMGGIMFAYGILLALIARERLGIGQIVDVSLLGAQITWQSALVTSYLRSKKIWLGPEKESMRVCMGQYRTGDDKWLVLSLPGDERAWPDLCRAVGREDLIKDAKCVNREAREANKAELIPIFEGIFLSKPRQEWLEILGKNNVPHAPVLDYAEMADDPQVLENEYVVTLDHPEYGSFRCDGIPVKLSKTPGKIRTFAPKLGEHNDDILESVGYTADEIARLREEGVI